MKFSKFQPETVSILQYHVVENRKLSIYDENFMTFVYIFNERKCVFPVMDCSHAAILFCSTLHAVSGRLCASQLELVICLILGYNTCMVHEELIL